MHITQFTTACAYRSVKIIFIIKCIAIVSAYCTAKLFDVGACCPLPLFKVVPCN